MKYRQDIDTFWEGGERQQSAMSESGTPLSRIRHERGVLKAINKLAIGLMTISSSDELAWYVARDIVANMGFTDCVVYYLDESKNLLVQRAVIGNAKNPAGNEIVNRLEIPVGTGITGHVAATGEPIIVADVSDDPRYISDIELAGSEICVPLLVEERVVGVIDCEDPRVGHFGKFDLEALTTVASIVAAKIKIVGQDQSLETMDALRESEIRFRHFAEASSDWFWETDSQHRFIWKTKKGEGITDIGIDLLRGKTRWQIPGPVCGDEAFWAPHRALLEQRRPFRNMVYPYYRNNGTLGYIRADGVPVFDAGGEFRGYRGTGREISEIHEAELRLNATLDELSRAKESYSLAARMAKLGHFAFDELNDEYLEISDEYAEIFGYTVDEFMHSYKVLESDMTLVHPDDRKALEDTYDEVLDERSKNSGFASYRILNRDGDTRFVRELYRITRNENGLPIKTDGIVQDITELKQAQLDAEQANRAKTEFLSSMSHELRTPLNAILGLSQLFEYKADLNPEHRQNAREIHKAGEHLLSLITEVLDLARIESGNLEVTLEPVALDTVLNECLKLIKPMAAERGIITCFEIPECKNDMIFADYTRLKQVLLNLMSNAVKYNRDHGHLDIHCHPVDGGRIRISICDTGDGIDESDLGRLFRPFERLGAKFGEVEGNGIGLVITRDLVQLMDGEIGVESTPGKGSCFWVEFQKAEDSLVEAISSARATAAVDIHPLRCKGKILVAEDNPANEALLRQQMEMLEIEADFVDDGAIALERLTHGDYVLLLTDVNMPGMDGYELATRVRAAERDSGARLPIVALTANAMAEDRKRCRENDMDGFITKPASLGSLHAELSRWSFEENPMKNTTPSSARADVEMTQEPAADVEPALDITMLRDLVGDDRASHCRLLNKFMETTPAILDAIGEAQMDCDDEALRQQAHKLKSSARSMGAHALADACAALEEAGKSGDRGTIEDMAPRLGGLYDGIVAYVQDYCSEA